MLFIQVYYSVAVSGTHPFMGDHSDLAMYIREKFLAEPNVATILTTKLADWGLPSVEKT